ncbi:MAG TPA: S9 family peptidase [Cyclobacteriaceae bacterium]|nr:S9 family peptidase [Cyclobacteriaceae bacterium]
MKLLSVIALMLVSVAVFAQKKFDLAAQGKLVSLSDPQISPDGKSIVIVTSRPDYDANRHNSELVIVDIATGKSRPLTFDRVGVSQPRFSPAGDQLTFLARGKDSQTQIFVMNMAGGESKQITKAPKGIQQYAWSPDGSTIAFVASDEPANKEQADKGYDAFEVGNNDMFVSNVRTAAHIWIMPSAGGEAKRLTSGTWTLPITIPPGAPASPISWSPDGKTIAFVKVGSIYSGDNAGRSIQLLNVADGSIRQITKRTEYEGYPTFSPDGTKLTYWYLKDATRGNINDIWLTSASGGEGKNLTAPIDRDMYRAIWMPDSKNVLVGGHDDHRTSLWLQPVDGPARKLNLGTISPNWSFWVDMTVGKNGSIAFIGTDPSHPAELYYMVNANTAPKKLTTLNSEIAEMALGKTETVRWQLEGFDHSGSLTYPSNYSTEKKYPLVLIVHGGPNAASIENFSARAQLFASEGYFVFEPNYRGSDNLGSKYKLAIQRDAGAGPGRDVMEGVKKLKKSGMIDTTRMAVTGWSYGGYMTAWLAGNYSGWKAAVAGAAVTDLVDQYNLSDGNIAWGKTLGSPYTGNMQAYIDQSPITYAHNIKAPTLILANTEDPRVPVTQSYKLYHALKDNGVNTRFIAWPIPLHNASDPVRAREVTKYWMGWVDEHLGDGKMNATLKKETPQK